MIKDNWKVILDFFKRFISLLFSKINLFIMLNNALKTIITYLFILIISLLPITIGAVFLFTLDNTFSLILFLVLGIFNISYWVTFIFRLLDELFDD